MPTFTGTGPFKFTLGLSEQANSAAIKNPDLAIGLKVISQTPAVCRVASTFNRATGKYSITVVGISNGQCRISAIDKGNDEKFPTATEIKQSITGITAKKTVATKAVKPTPAAKPVAVVKTISVDEYADHMSLSLAQLETVTLMLQVLDQTNGGSNPTE